MLPFQYLISFCCCLSLAGAIVVDNSHTHAHTTKLISAHAQHRRQQTVCQPLGSTLSQSDVSQSSNSPFVGISPSDSYEATGSGLQMFLKRPEGTVTTQGHVNSALGQGATINSTFTILYGKVTYEMKAPQVAGSVTAAILISDGHHEIDVELLGGDPHHWQTNIYAPSPHDTQPLWGVFGELEDFHSSTSVTDYHNYTIDWTKNRIIWSVDGHTVRTLKRSETKINGTEHYPSQASRIQLGIWDASSPEGTSEWAKGPIDWDNAPSTISATVKSVRVECD